MLTYDGSRAHTIEIRLIDSFTTGLAMPELLFWVFSAFLRFPLSPNARLSAEPGTRLLRLGSRRLVSFFFNCFPLVVTSCRFLGFSWEVLPTYYRRLKAASLFVFRRSF